MSKNPLGGISIPSIESIVDDAVDSLGRGKLDLANDDHRERLSDALIRRMGQEFHWQIAKAFGQACTKACEHVVATMADTNYQARRETAKRLRMESRRQREIEYRAALNADKLAKPMSRPPATEKIQ